MKIERYIKARFTVIGMEDSTKAGEGFIARLFAQVNARAGEIAALVKKDDSGNIPGCWGCMSDFSRSFLPWENDFSQGLYLAGLECEDNVEAPAGWTRWIIPSFEYLVAEVDSPSIFKDVLALFKNQGLRLTGAVQDYNCFYSGRNYMFFPIKRL